MINNSKIFNFQLFCLYIFPFILITGPAIPDIILTLISIIFIIRLFKYKEYKKINQSWFKSGIILWLWFIFVSFFAFNKFLAFTDSLIFIRFLLFILAIQTSLIINEKIRENLFKIIFIFVVLITFDSFYQFINYNPEFGFSNDLLGRNPDGAYGRLSGPFKDLVPGSVVTKFFFISLLCILFNKIKITDNHKVNYFFLTIANCSMITIVFCSGERMALASLMLGLFLSFLFLKKSRKIIAYSFSISSIVYLLIYNFHPIYNDYKILESSSLHEGLIIEKKIECKNSEEIICNKTISVQPKFIEVLKDFNNSAYGEIYYTAINIWKDNKLFGVGLNNFTYVCKNNNYYDQYHKNDDCRTHPHNFYIQALVESGIIGLFLFIYFVYTIFKTIVKSSNLIEYKILFLITLTMIFWPIMSTGSFLKNWHMALICFIIGICLSNPKKKYLD